MASEARDIGGGVQRTVTVCGQAVIRAEPDEALLWITLSALEPTPGPALADVSARSQTLVGMLDELGIAAADRSTTGVSVAEEFDHTPKGRRSLGHRASSSLQVRLLDPGVIGRLVAHATEQLAARVDGPRWQIAPDNPVRLDAARQAAADAQRKARAYAEGVGARLGAPLVLAESDHSRMIQLAGGGWRAAAGHDGPAIEAGEHEVAAAIQVTFALEPD